MENWLLSRNKFSRKFPKPRVISENYPLIEVQGKWDKTGKYLNFTNRDIREISKESFDIIIRCGSGIISGKILELPKFGILSQHLGDNRTNRGGPPGFWEVYEKNPTSGFVIQRLTDELDGGLILYRGNVYTQSTWFLNSFQLRTKANFFMKSILLKIANDCKLPEANFSYYYDRKILKMKKSVFVLIKYSLNVYLPKLLKLFNLNKVVMWEIRFNPTDKVPSQLSKFKRIKPLHKTFCADPFIIEHNNQKVIFFELFDEKSNKGVIAAVDVDSAKNEPIIVLEENFHMSFPFVFKFQNRIFMIPETSSVGAIRLYECKEFPYRWEFHSTLIDNIDAADSMIFYISKTWYLLTNVCSANIGDHNSELHVYYSSKLFGGEWQPIKSGNPVVFNPLKARNGGFILKDGQLYRVNQVPRYGSYGEKIEINRVVKLDSNQYQEEFMQELKPLFDKRYSNLHHLTIVNEMATFDLGVKRFSLFK